MVQQRLPSLLDPPIAFAHRGARAHAPENTLEAFSLALRLGATGLESDVRLTSDGVPVLHHDASFRRGLRRAAIAETRHGDLPEDVCSLDALLRECGTDFELSLDAKDPDCHGAIAEVVRTHDLDLVGRTWICDPSAERLTELRDELIGFHLVHSRRLERLDVSPELHASRLAAAGIDAMNMHAGDWNGGLVVMFHRFEVLAFGWDLQFDHQLTAGIRMGLDAVYSDHVDVMMDVVRAETGTP